MSFLRVIQHEVRTIEWWLQQRSAERLDLSPAFQRRSELWSRYKRAHLIDSILNGFDIPKFYVADFTLGQSELNTARRPYAVIDGKQRFEAIFGFINDEFPLNQSSTFDADQRIVIKGLKFSEIQREYPVLAKSILRFEPVVMSVTTDDENKIYEMFVRLNSGEAANSAERRNAKPGPVPGLVRELVEHAFFQNRISFTIKRMADFNLAAKLLLIQYRNGFVDTKASNLDRFVLEAAEQTTSPGFEEPAPEQIVALKRYVATKDKVVSVLEGLSEVFHKKDILLSAAGRIPVYYWLMHEHPEVLPNLRDFLDSFERDVLDAMRRARAGEQVTSDYLTTYYTLSRTTNDQKSLRGRYDIIVRQLKRRHLID